jgi:hypothetical protein
MWREFKSWGIKIYTGNIYYDRQYFNKFALLADTAIQAVITTGNSREIPSWEIL